MTEATDKYQILKDSFVPVLQDCELCGSNEIVTFQEYGRTGKPGEYGRLGVTICKRCGLKMQNPRYPDEFYEAYYKELYREVAFGDLTPSDAYLEEQKARGEGVRQWFSKHVTTVGKMLDHGCASGCTMLGWKQAGWSCTGIDPHKPSVDTGQSLGLDVRLGVGEHVPFDNGIFDLVLSLGSLEHSYKLRQSFDEIMRVLKDDGHLVIRWRSNEIFGSPLEYYNHNHYRFFTPKTLELAVKLHGFEIVAETTDKLEGWDSYSYLLVKKPRNSKASSHPAEVKEGDGDCFQEELVKINQIRSDFYKRAKLHAKNADRFLASKPQGYDIDDLRALFSESQFGFLGGDPENVLLRSAMEAVSYIKEFDAGRVK